MPQRMNDQINPLLSQMAALEAELRAAVHSRKSPAFFQTQSKRVGFEKSARNAHR
ncbi:MAG: hypothetical protein JWR60_1893 [Polaromonas sp.]|nr:hypothetical protein [Polaromonas sp.]